MLRRANLVVPRKDGTTVSYSLSGPSVAELLAVARGILTGVITGQLELLDDLQNSAGVSGDAHSPEAG
ncbi:ArsR family transcriptional regulator [Amycolatopsis decaplanina DSM 44594]|uniref:ArsR family transcriptional regulator n=1 Tax=Amycolatopsis decaplanina DSM 44594 TaxID=1284240 RepID=M2Z5F4_9PSEU|nr:ArsR family transcriptional regulator [Amycolatopsis decaplanina DSM 44594]